MFRSKLYNHFLQTIGSFLANLFQEVMSTTVAQERIVAEHNSKEGAWAVFKGRNLIRFLIACWPKVVQQFVGLAVFNTYATYFCKSSMHDARVSRMFGY